MKKATIKGFLILLILSAILPQNNYSHAQDSWKIQLNQVYPVESPESMTLKVYFTVFESNSGIPITEPEITSGQVTLINVGFSANALIKKPDIPIYIALVMDASGSMGGSAEVLKEAAKLSLNDIPDDAYFSVIQFDENIQLLQDFTENISAVSYAIDSYKVSKKGTCLYDAAYTAIEAMAKLPVGRRAVILFTDGKDEKADGSICSRHRYQELIDLAMKSQVPLNTIGLSTKEANINSVELQAMASSTGGVAAVASKDDLGAAFTRIMTALKAQWMAEIIVYPKKGANNAVLALDTKDGILNAAFTVESETDYPGPPSPVLLNLSGLVLNAATKSYDVQLGVTSPGLVDYIKVEIWDQDGGAKVGEFIFNELREFNSLLIPTNDLNQDVQYELRISAISKEDQTPFIIERDDRGNTFTQLIHEFTFDPSSAFPALEVLSVASVKGDLLLNVSVTNPELVAGFDGWLINSDTNTQVAGSNFSSPPLANPSGQLTIPMRENAIKNGKYSLVVRVLANDGSVYSTVTYPEVTYKAPSLFARIGTSLMAQPILLIVIAAIVLLVVLFLIISSARQKSFSGTPVLQGRLGARANSGFSANEPYIPIAENEPIPLRQVKSAPPPPIIQPSPSPIPPSFSDMTPPVQLPQDQFIPSVVAAPPPMPAAPQHVSEKMPPSVLATMIEQPAPKQTEEPGETLLVSARPKIPLPTITIKNTTDGTILKNAEIIAKFPFTIGRSEGDLNLQDLSISRKHLEISFNANEQKYYVTDLNSKNGSSLNGKPMPANEPQPVDYGAVIGLGPNIIIHFERT